MLYLTEQPNSIKKQDITRITYSPKACQFILKAYQKCHGNLLLLNASLIKSFRAIEPRYQPREAHDFIKSKNIPQGFNRTDINNIVGFNETLFDYFHFKKQALYLITNYNKIS